MRLEASKLLLIFWQFADVGREHKYIAAKR